MRLTRPLAALAAASLAFSVAACDEQADDPAALGVGEEGDVVEAVAAPDGTQWSEQIQQTDDGGYLMGNPDAKIRLVEFGSLTCSHCADFAKSAMEPLVSDYVNSGRVAFEFRNFVRDPIDITGAMLTRCGADESFFALTEQFFENQPAFFEAIQGAGEQAQAAIQNAPADQRFLTVAEVTGMVDFFAARGIARDQALACLGDTATAQSLADTTQAQAERYNLTGTPSFLLNNSKIDAGSWEQVEAALQRAGAR